jgi:hypothetical protein
MRWVLSSSYPFPTLRRVGTTCFSSYCDKDSAIICTTGRLPDVNASLKLEWVLTTAYAAGANSLTCLPKNGRARDNKFWSPILWLTFEDVAWLPRSHTKRTDRGAIEPLIFYINLRFYIIYVKYVCIYKKNVFKYVFNRYLESITQA